MSKISLEQRFTLLARVGETIDWDSLTTEQVQVGIREAPRAGAEATALIRNGFRMQVGDFFRETGEFSIEIPALGRPTLADLQAKFDWIKSIESDISPTEAVTMKPGTVLRPDEPSIDGKEYEIRRRSLAGRIHGYQQLVWLVDHQDQHPAFKALLGQIYVGGPGLIVVSTDGNRYFPYLGYGGRRWLLHWYSSGRGLDRHGRIAVSGK